MLGRLAGARAWDAPWARLLGVPARDHFITLLRYTIQTIQDAGLEKKAVEAIRRSITNQKDQAVIEAILAARYGTQAPLNAPVSVLFLAAEPTDESALRLGTEFREINELLAQQPDAGQRIILEMPQFAVRPKDLLRSVLGYRPTVVHFSGHGAKSGGLMFEADDGRKNPIEPEALEEFFSQCSDYVECVVLNACHSATQAKAISRVIPNAIGMNDYIGNPDAVKFAIGFYTSLIAAPGDYPAAVRAGRSLMQLQNSTYHDVPGLYHNGDLVAL